MFRASNRSERARIAKRATRRDGDRRSGANDVSCLQPIEASERSEAIGASERSEAIGASERAKRSEPRARSAPAKRRARARVGESEGRSPSVNDD